MCVMEPPAPAGALGIMPAILTVTEDCQRPILMGGGVGVVSWAAAKAVEARNSARDAREAARNVMVGFLVEAKAAVSSVIARRTAGSLPETPRVCGRRVRV